RWQMRRQMPPHQLSSSSFRYFLTFYVCAVRDLSGHVVVVPKGSGDPQLSGEDHDYGPEHDDVATESSHSQSEIAMELGHRAAAKRLSNTLEEGATEHIVRASENDLAEVEGRDDGAERDTQPLASFPKNRGAL